MVSLISFNSIPIFIIITAFKCKKIKRNKGQVNNKINLLEHQFKILLLQIKMVIKLFQEAFRLVSKKILMQKHLKIKFYHHYKMHAGYL